MLSTRRLPARPARSRSSMTLAGLADTWRRTARGDNPDWTRLRGALDVLAQHPGRLPDALEPRPKPSGSPVMDALLAGIADKLADDALLPRPAGTKQTPGLESKWSAPGTSAMLAARRAATPPQLKERGLVLDESSLWRGGSSPVPATSRTSRARPNTPSPRPVIFSARPGLVLSDAEVRLVQGG